MGKHISPARRQYKDNKDSMPKPGTKRAKMLDMMRRKEGATIEQLIAADVGKDQRAISGMIRDVGDQTHIAFLKEYKRKEGTKTRYAIYRVEE